jgi:hypothetical protein
MSTDSSQFLAGELVEVRSRDEILRTLDADGSYEGVPFMPEMLAHCDQRFRVYKRAHKTCDFVNKTGVRQLPSCSHLENLRCDGSAHGGCQAQCLFFWKDAWLKSVERAPDDAPSGPGCSEQQVWASSKRTPARPDAPDPAYRCQATELPAFTRPMPTWDLGQYVEDYRSGNVASLRSFLPRAGYRAYDTAINLGLGLGRPLRWLYNSCHRLVDRDLYPATPGTIRAGEKTPTAALNLQPGELVRVKDHAAILATIDEYNKNRGMSFSAEMAPYCGKTYRVLSRVRQILDEKTGRMLRMKNECIILEGVICRAQFNKNMIFCPRATYPYWREIWLERVDDAPLPAELTATTSAAPATVGST